MSKKGQQYKNYSSEFKIGVIMDMCEHHLGFRETVRKYWETTSRSEESNYLKTLKGWERIYLEEGAEGLMTERRSRACAAGGTRKGRPPKLTKRLKKI